MAQTKDESTKPIPEPVFMLRKIRAPERYLPNGKYNAKPLSPTYTKDYYHRMRADVECPHCFKIYKHKDTLRNHIKRTKKCILQQEKNKLKALEVTEDVAPETA